MFSIWLFHFSSSMKYRRPTFVKNPINGSWKVWPKIRWIVLQWAAEMFNPPRPHIYLHGLISLQDAHFISTVQYILRQRFLSQFTLFLNSLNKHLFPDANVFCLWIMSRFSSLVIHGRSFTQTLRERSGNSNIQSWRNVKYQFGKYFWFLISGQGYRWKGFPWKIYRL